jgi:hypothetical protein
VKLLDRLRAAFGDIGSELSRVRDELQAKRAERERLNSLPASAADYSEKAARWVDAQIADYTKSLDFYASEILAGAAYTAADWANVRVLLHNPPASTSPINISRAVNAGLHPGLMFVADPDGYKKFFAARFAAALGDRSQPSVEQRLRMIAILDGEIRELAAREQELVSAVAELVESSRSTTV